MISGMATLQLNLADDLKTVAESRATAAGYDSVDQYIVSLIQADEVAPISDAMEAQLLRGLDSGPAVQITPEFIANLRQRARQPR
jgi:antitoxin ParD1/3/4